MYGKEKSLVSIYNTCMEMEEAVRELQKSGFDMKKLSIVGKDYHAEENVVGYYNTGGRSEYWGKLGTFWSGLWNVLFGSAFFVIPGIGPLVAGGPLVSRIVEALEGDLTTEGLGAPGAALYSIGIPKDSIFKYEASLKTNNFLLLAHDTIEEVEHACKILGTTNAVETTIHHGKAIKSEEV